jgi:hypothetical protein
MGEERQPQRYGGRGEGTAIEAEFSSCYKNFFDASQKV